jgi:uncharacterized protein (DUF427 family)
VSAGSSGDIGYDPGMPKATWNGATLASSDATRVVEGNHYFPIDAVDKSRLEPSDHHTTCGWKGEASYYNVVVDGQRNENAAWFYPSTKPEAKQIEGYVAFWKGVVVE